MRLHQFSFFGFAALTLGLLPGCAGGQTGDLSGHNDGQETATFGGCEEHRQKLASFDAETDAGTANELLADAERSFDAPLTWNVAGEGQSWRVGPESGTGRIHIDVARGASAYALTYSPPPNDSGQELGSAALCPPPQLGVEARVSVTTDGGALAESYDTLLRTSVAGIASLDVPLDLKKLNGELAVSLSASHAKMVQTSLVAMLSAAGTAGSISGIEQVDSGSGPGASSSARPAVLAVWPGGAACAGAPAGKGLVIPVESSALGSTGTATIAAVTPAPASDISWLNGDTTTLTVGIAANGDGCLSVRDDLPAELDGGARVTYPVTLTLKSADGKLDGSYAGEVVATGSGSARRVHATVSLTLTVDDVAKTGFKSLSVPADADGLLLRVDSQLVNGNASGSLDLFALASPPCASDPAPRMSTPTPGSGASSPGCMGQSQTRLETASWGD